MARPELGNVQQVRLHKIWKDEPGYFTPWLFNNLPLLGAALRMDLEPVQREVFTGNFWLDILAKDVKSGQDVAIENQLAWSDNSHMGQVLTYAAHFDARTLVWVSPKFYDVHRAAIDWLNRWMDNEIKIFGVEVSAIRIGESPVAVEFRPVAFPDSWRQ